MQRFFALVALFLLSIPVGMSIAGCGGSNPNNYCLKNGFGYGEKTTDLAAISLGPASTGISLAYGQTGSLSSPSGTNCNGGSVSVAHYVYGTSNLNLADINPATGSICAGTWNRHSASGIPDFTICTPPTTGPGTATVTASASAVTSNPVTVYIHPPITAITIPNQSTCVSQNQVLSDASGNPLPLTTGTQVFGPDGALIPSQYVGTVTYNAVNTTVVNINNTSNGTTGTGTTGTTTTTSTVNGLATAHLPGSTVINATISGVTSAAGYFFTCAPQSIQLSLNGSEGKPTPVTVSGGNPQNLLTAVTDTTNAAITGLSLDYTSTQPKQIAVSAAGSVSSTYPTTATISAICQPGTCNPSPINIVGKLGNGLPVSSNTVVVNSPGRSSSKIWLASSQSPYFTEVDLTAGGSPTPVLLPYLPNSMVLDQAGGNLYFGSYHELMVVSAASNGLSKQDPNVPGVVLAVSPDASTVVINDQVRQIIYLYTQSTGAFTSTGGLATRAQFSPDGKNLYLVGPGIGTDKNTLYVHNAVTGWSTYQVASAGQGTNVCSAAQMNNNTDPTTFDPFCSPDVAVAVPSIAAFLSGSSAEIRGYCPNTTTAPPVYYPSAGSAGIASDHLTATYDGAHILGATASPAQIEDVSLSIQQGACPSGNTGLTFTQNATAPTPQTTGPVSGTYTFNATALGVSPTEITGVVTSPDSTMSFVTYNATNGSGILPAYAPSTTYGAAGTLNPVQLSGGATAPITGAFSPDDTLFFVGTAGDNLLHLISVPGLQDTQTIDPKLVSPSGAAVPVQFIAVQPRATT